MRISVASLLALYACAAPTPSPSDNPDAGSTPAECAVLSQNASSGVSIAALSAGFSQSHSRYLHLRFLPSESATCCSSYASSLSGDAAPVGTVSLVLHQDGPGEYAIVSDYKACVSADADPSDCPAGFTAGVTYVAAAGKTIVGTGTLQVDEGAAFDERRISGSVDVTFDVDGTAHHLVAAFAGQMCGTE